jgi:CRISPR-associated endoribonuclease Cas6
VPIATVLHSILQEDLETSRITGEALHGLFFGILAQINERLVVQLHETAGTKPFTLALANWGKQRKLKRGQELRIRFTFLNDALFMKFADASMNPKTKLEFQHVGLVPIMINLSSTELLAKRGTWSGSLDYKKLYESAKATDEITLQFATPTSFKQGDTNTLFPAPKLAFKGYLEKWNKYSDIPLEDSILDKIEESAILSQYELKTLPFSDGRAVIPGFVGTSTFKIKNKDKEFLRSVNLLADFSFFAGTGRKTTHGMGMTRRLTSR